MSFGCLVTVNVKYCSNDMKGTNDVWNMCIVKCITYRYLIEIMLIKEDTSGHDKITHNYDELRDAVCIKPPNGWYYAVLFTLETIILTYCGTYSGGKMR